MNLVSDIINYVRRIVKTPSDLALPDSLIIDYINRFYTYDAPARLQLFELKTKYNLITTKYIDQYNLPYNSDNNLQYQGLINPVFVDGVQVPLTISRQGFFNTWPNLDFNQRPVVGDGGTTYTFITSNMPLLRGHLDVQGNLDPAVYITAFDVNNNQQVITDSGTFTVLDQNVGNLIGDVGIGVNTINYVTGAVNVTFAAGIPVGHHIHIKYISLIRGVPRGVLFFNNIITLRPVPAGAYLVEFDAYLTPAAFLNTAEALKFGYMSEWLARGAARKILSDVGDTEQFSFYEPFFREQEMLVLRRTDRQNSIDRVPTIYSQGGYGYGSYWNQNY